MPICTSRLLALLSILVIALGTVPATAATVLDEVIRLTNAARADNGLPPLAKQSQLTSAAQKHAADMGANDYFDHTGQDGSSPSDRAAREGYIGASGENIAAGQPTPQIVVTGWMNSPGHRANILNPDYTIIGVGYQNQNPDPGNLNFQHYWVQVFGIGVGTASITPPRLITPTPVTVGVGERIRIRIRSTEKARRFVTRGKVPPGIRIRRNSGRIVGRITTPGTYRFRVRAKAQSGNLKPVRVIIRVN